MAASEDRFEGLVLVVPPQVLDELVERVVQRLAGARPPDVEPWVGVEAVARHLGCRRQRIYDLVSRRGRGGIPRRVVTRVCSATSSPCGQPYHSQCTCMLRNGSFQTGALSMSSPSPSPPPPDIRGFFGWLSRRPKTAFWVTLITALLVGIGLGAASATDQQALDDANAKADKAQLQLDAQRAEVRRLRVKADGLQTKADSTAEALQTTNTALKRATAKAEVPRFVGSDAADATDDQTVTQLHWKLRSNTQATDAASPGTVLSQIPKPGTVLKGGKTITLVVARRPPPKPKQWVTIKTFSGGSSTKTPEFHIPSGVKARLTYTMPQDSNNAITLYRAPSEYVDLLLNEIGPQHGSTRLYQPGTFYLDVDGAYTIDVQVFKRPS